VTGATLLEIPMPRLSDQGEEATVIKWLKQPGESVVRGEPLVEIETDKANMVVEAPEGGALHIVAPEGETLPVGAPIAAGGRLGRAARHRVYFEVRIKLGPGGFPIDPEPLLAKSK